MPILSNPRRERFAQEIAKGKTYTKAYVVAGYRPHDGNACTLAQHPEVIARLEELRSKAAHDVEVTVGSLIREAGEIQAAAIAAGQMAAAVSALTAKAKIAGKWIERKETGAPGEFGDIDNMDADQLRAYVAQNYQVARPDPETDKSLN
jgi:phage terminase small subunit